MAPRGCLGATLGTPVKRPACVPASGARSLLPPPKLLSVEVLIQEVGRVPSVLRPPHKAGAD